MYFQRVREKIQQFVFQSDKIQRDIQQTVLKIKIFFESERMLVNTGNSSLLSKHFLQSSKTSPKPTQTIFTMSTQFSYHKLFRFHYKIEETHIWTKFLYYIRTHLSVWAFVCVCPILFHMFFCFVFVSFCLVNIRYLFHFFMCVMFAFVCCLIFAFIAINLVCLVRSCIRFLSVLNWIAG